MYLVFQETAKTVCERKNLTITATRGGMWVVTTQLKVLMVGIGIHSMNAVSMENVIGNENDKETGNAMIGIEMEDVVSDPREDARLRRDHAPPGRPHPPEIALQNQRKQSPILTSRDCWPPKPIP